MIAVVSTSEAREYGLNAMGIRALEKSRRSISSRKGHSKTHRLYRMAVARVQEMLRLEHIDVDTAVRSLEAIEFARRNRWACLDYRTVTRWATAKSKPTEDSRRY